MLAKMRKRVVKCSGYYTGTDLSLHMRAFEAFQGYS